MNAMQLIIQSAVRLHTKDVVSMQKVERDMQWILPLEYHKFINIHELPTEMQ